MIVNIAMMLIGGMVGYVISQWQKDRWYKALRGLCDSLQVECEQRMRENFFLLKMADQRFCGDDAEPLTAEWLMHVGWLFDEPDDGMCFIPFPPNHPASIELSLDDFELWLDGERTGHIMENRGMVRSLCHGLGVKLEEAVGQ